MSQCLSPDCLAINPQNAKVCQKCGSKLLLSDRYRAIKILGKGGFGRTFLAVDEQKPSKPRCVIKQFLPQVKTQKGLSKAAELFAREADKLDRLGKHSQIPELLAFFGQEDRQYLIQEFIDGNDLKKELATKGVFNQAQIEELLADMLTVLEFVHANNVIHRDIKPENIIRRQQDNKLVLVDFGAAKELADENVSVTGTVIGSAAYIAPEQAAGKPKLASDLYSLGTTCLHLLTNTEPTNLFDLAEGEWIWREYLQGNEIGYELSRVLDKLVEGATKRRYQTVAEVLEALSPKTKYNSDSVSSNMVNATTNTATVSQARTHRRRSQAARYGVKSASVAPAKTTESRRKATSIQNLELKIVEYRYSTLAKNDAIAFDKPGPLKTINHQGRAKYATFELSPEVNLDLIGVPGGKFIMGSPDHEAERSDNESPRHGVQIRPFFLGRYPITQAQWQAVMGSNPAKFDTSNLHPVERVSWFDCLEFCQKLSEIVGRTMRLPTEAEWEHACRGKQTNPWPFHSGMTITTELANYNGEFTYGDEAEGESRDRTTPVGSFAPNCYGLYDLHGNVAEWCEDTWHNNYQGAPNDGSAWLGGNNRTPRVLRGGSWLHLPGSCRSAYRLKAEPTAKSDAFGLRVASSL